MLLRRDKLASAPGGIGSPRYHSRGSPPARVPSAGPRPPLRGPPPPAPAAPPSRRHLRRAGASPRRPPPSPPARRRVRLRPPAVAAWPRPPAAVGRRDRRGARAGVAPAGASRLASCRRRRRGDVVARLRLVHPHHAVVVVGDRPEVAGRPAVHEGVRIDARHAPLRHLRQLEVREERQLGEEDRIEVRVLRRRRRCRCRAAAATRAGRA